MSAIFGLIPSTAAEWTESKFRRGASKLREWPSDRVESIIEPSHCFMINRRFSTPEAEAAIPLEDQHNTIILFDGRLDNREELSRKLNIDSSAADDTFVRASWMHWGDKFAQHLLGDFAICIYCQVSGKLILARDHLGVKPLFYTQTGELFAFSTAIQPLLKIAGVSHEWDRVWLADYLEQTNADVGRTAYRSINALPPAHVLSLKNRVAHLRQYWSLPTYENPIAIGRTEAYAKVGELLDKSVACRLRGRGNIAAELSGGLDSSSVVAVAAEQLAGTSVRLAAITQVFPPGPLRDAYADQDESRLAALVCAHCSNIDQSEIANSDDSLFDEIQRSLNAHGVPQRRDFTGYASEGLLRVQNEGARIVLSGFGGDQLVSSQIFGLAESFWDERDYSAWRDVMSLRRGRVGAWARYLFRRVFPPEPTNSPRFRSANGHLASESLRREAGYPERANLHPIFPGTGAHREREARIIAGPALVFRLQETAIGAGAHGIEYRYPLLDIRLLEFVHNLPTRYRRHMGLGRLPLREAMRGRLPDEVRLRNDKGGTAIPGVVVNIIKQATELREYLELAAKHGRLADLVRFDDVLIALRTIEKKAEQPHFQRIDSRDLEATFTQILRLVLLCRWVEHDAEQASA